MVLAEQINGAGYVMLALVVIGVMLMLRNFRRGGGAQTGTRASRSLRPTPSDRGHHLDAPAELQKWEVELHALGREVSARIDNKISMLQHLIITAEQQSERLEQAIAASQGHTTPPGSATPESKRP